MSLVEPACVVVGSAQIGALDEAGLRERAASVVVVVGEGCDDRPWASRVCVWPALLEASDRAEVVKPTSRRPFQLLLTSGTTGRQRPSFIATRALRSAFRHVLHCRVREEDVL